MRALALLPALLAACATPEVPTPDGPAPSFAADIEPLLRERCLSCHTEPTRGNGGLGYVRVVDEHFPVDGDIDYTIARATAVRAACTAISQEVADAYADTLVSVAYESPCAGTYEGEEIWARYSMPPGAGLKLSPEEQVMFVRWIEAGFPE